MKIDPDGLPLPKEPYRGILPFRLLDWRIFLERDLETERLGNLVSMYSGVLLYGQSGAGKSSLLNAGLLPDVLRRGRAPERIRVFPERRRELVVERMRLQEEDVIQENGLPRYLPSRFSSADGDERIALSCEEFLKILRAPSDLGVPLLIFDQFEELVTLFEENPKDEERFKEARQTRTAIEQLLCELLLNEPLPLKIVFAFRDDYLARLGPLFSRIPNLMDQGLRLALPRVERLEQIVRGPFVHSEDGERGLPGHFANELSEELAKKIAGGIRASKPSGLVNLSEVQTLCLALWLQPERRDELLRAADPPAVLQKIIESKAMDALNELLPWDRVPAIALLSNLVTKEGTRDVVSEENVISETRRNPLMWLYRGNWTKLLHELPGKTGLLRRSLSSGTTYYELASEFLISWIQKQQQALRRKALIIWGYLFAGLLVLLFLLVVLATVAYIAKGEAEKALDYAEDAKNRTTKALDVANEAKAAAVTERKRAEVGEKAAKEARTEAENVRKWSDSLVGFVTSVDKDLAHALESAGKADLLAEFRKRLADYRNRYLDALPNTGSLEEQLAEIHSLAKDLEKSGDSSGALQLYIQGFRLAKKEIDRRGDDSLHMQMWLVRYLRDQGDVLMTQGNMEQANQRFQEALVIAQQLSLMDSGNAELQSELSLSYEKIGDLLSVQGDLPGALSSYDKSLVIRENLVSQDPANAVFQNDLSTSYEKVGDVQIAQGDLSDALNSYRNSLVIREKLAKQDPGNAVWQSKLSLSHALVDYVLSAQERRSARPRSSPGTAAILNNLAELYQSMGDYAKAERLYKRAAAIKEKSAGPSSRR